MNNYFLSDEETRTYFSGLKETQNLDIPAEDIISVPQIMKDNIKRAISLTLTKYHTPEEKKQAKKRNYKNFYLKNREKMLELSRKKYKELRKNPEWVEKDKARKRKPKETHKRNKLWKTWRITFDNGETIEMTGITKWCKENSYNDAHLYQIAKGKRKKHKDIVAVEELDHTPLD